jgi:hypothetical protein
VAENRAYLDQLCRLEQQALARAAQQTRLARRELTGLQTGVRLNEAYHSSRRPARFLDRAY